MQYLSPVVSDLLSQDRRQTIFELLDFYYSHITSLADIDVVGSLALNTDYRTLHLKCARLAVEKSETDEQRYLAGKNLIKALVTMNYPDDALDQVEKNLSIQPHDFDLLSTKASILSLMNRKEEADEYLDELLEKYPHKEEDLRPLFCSKQIRQGRVAEGIHNFLNGTKKRSTLFEDDLQMHKWTGEETEPGQKIYILSEGGIGDNLINVRFFDQLRDRGMRPILYSSHDDYYRSAFDMLERHGYEIVYDPYMIDPSAMWTSVLFLPPYLNVTEDDLWNGPYLTPLRQKKNRLESTNKMRIGIKCSGNPYFQQDEYRSVPIDEMVDALPKNAEIYYLDVGKGIEHERVTDLSPQTESWEDTLDFIDQMDVIVSSCTSLVHAAGAMGKRAMVLPPIAEYYVWTSSRNDESTPWYGDNFYVLKQQSVRSWKEPLKRVSEILNEESSI